ncbi:MAG: hypothetical protein QNJ09_06480, partial [Paracoccaceae bacterium]|nr:hypothetical protein [Paracoccaceae bacterium]
APPPAVVRLPYSTFPVGLVGGAVPMSLAVSVLLHAGQTAQNRHKQTVKTKGAKAHTACARP